MFDEPAAGGAPETRELEYGLSGFTGRRSRRGLRPVRDEAEFEALLEEERVAEVPAGRKDAAFDEDGVDVLAPGAAEGVGAGVEPAERARHADGDRGPGAG